MSTVEEAVKVAASAHAGQLDKAGQPYILHPLRVMQAMKDNARRIVAVLHDVVEDTTQTIDSLRERGFNEEILTAVDALTRREGEDYFEFVARAASNHLARPVKIADIRDNLDVTRLTSPTESDRERTVRYKRALKLAEALGRYWRDDVLTAPTILPLREKVTLEEVEAECPGQGEVYACDFKVDGAETWERIGCALNKDSVWNIDHHADLPEYQGPLTSTVLATEFLKDHEVGPSARVVINHTDCDSILSSALMMGFLKLDREFEAASVHADHTGRPHRIADLLQGLDETRSGDRTDEQYLESLRNLKLLMAGEPLEPAGAAALESRERDRQRASVIAQSLQMRRIGRVASVTLEEEIDGSLFLPFIPWAAVLMVTGAHPWNAGHKLVKLRIGLAAPDELNLHNLSVTDFDPAYGGRWNAGSNKRGGGTRLSEGQYLTEVVKRVDRVLSGDSATSVTDHVEPSTAVKAISERLAAWAPGLYSVEDEIFSVDRTPNGGLTVRNSRGEQLDPLYVVTRGTKVPLTSDTAFTWLQGGWIFENELWNIAVDPETHGLRAWNETGRTYASPYLIISHGRRATHVEQSFIEKQTVS